MVKNSELMENLREKVKEKADKKKVEDCIENLRNYAKYKEMKDLY